MRSGKSKSQFFNSMKKKPALQNILDNMDDMTWEEIDAIRQPKWIKDILYKMKHGGGNLMTPESIAMSMAMGKGTPDTKAYSTYRYTGETRFVEGIEVFNGELLLMIDNDAIKISHTEIDKQLIEHQLQFVEKLETAADFINRKLDDDWNRLCPGEDRVVDQMGGAKSISGVNVTFRKIE